MSRTARIFPPVLLSTVALALSGCVVPAPAPLPTAAPTSASVPSPSLSPAPSTPAALFLDAEGYGALKLGMTKQEAIATGMVSGVSGTKGSCGAQSGAKSDGHLTGAPTSPDAVEGLLFFSATTHTLVTIIPIVGTTTPEGITYGSTVAELKAVYPAWADGPDDEGDGPDEGRGYIPLPGDKATYRIVVIDGKVTELSLASVDQDCYE